MTEMTINSTQSQSEITGKSMSLPRIMLSLEGVAIFISGIAAYWFIGGNWWLFAALILAPDLTFIIYMLDKRIGTIAYNIMHTLSLPVALGILSLFGGWQLGLALAIIWTAHIGLDRSIGYGLKYQSAFKDTHLQRA